MIKILETADIEELNEAQENWEIQHRPAWPEKLKCRFVIGRIGNIQIDLEYWNMPVELYGTSPSVGGGLAIPLHCDCSYLSRANRIGANNIDVYRPDEEVYALTRPDSGILAVTFLEDAGEGLTGQQAEKLSELRNNCHDSVQTTPETIARLRSWMLELLKLSAHDNYDTEFEKKLVDETLLIVGDAVKLKAPDSNKRLARRSNMARLARDYMLDNQSDPPSISNICHHLNVSERFLHQSFVETYSVSPKKFLKAQRLLAAHSQLKKTSANTSICSICHNLGFYDAGRFARDYTHMFGESPSDTRKYG